jgi:hypothetical protein
MLEMFIQYKKGPTTVPKWLNSNRMFSFSIVVNLHKFTHKNLQIIKKNQKDQSIIMWKIRKEDNKMINKNLFES